MLSIILKILSILGIILLVLLGIILTVLLLVLFFPICYRVKADRQPVALKSKNGQEILQEPEWAVHADVRAWWLFGLLRAGYQYPEPGVLKVKALFFTLYSSEADKVEDNEDTTGGKDTLSQKQKNEQAERSSDNLDISSKDKSADPEAKVTAEEIPPEQTSSEQIPSEQNLTLIEKIQYTIQRIYDKIKDSFEKINDIRENIAYYKEVLSSEEARGLLKHASMRLGKILKSIRPRKLHADIQFGAASPDTTGYVCAAYGMICCHLGKHVNFTPDFEQEILQGNLYAAGHITVFKLLWNGFMLFRDKRLWQLKDKLTNKQI